MTPTKVNNVGVGMPYSVAVEYQYPGQAKKRQVFSQTVTVQVDCSKIAWGPSGFPISLENSTEVVAKTILVPNTKVDDSAGVSWSKLCGKARISLKETEILVSQS